MIMLIAGYETTANTIAVLAYCAAIESSVQEKLYAEILETKEKFVSSYFNGLTKRFSWSLDFYYSKLLFDIKN